MTYIPNINYTVFPGFLLAQIYIKQVVKAPKRTTISKIKPKISKSNITNIIIHKKSAIYLSEKQVETLDIAKCKNIRVKSKLKENLPAKKKLVNSLQIYSPHIESLVNKNI